MKKIVSFVLTLVLLLSLVPVLPVAQAEAVSNDPTRSLITLKKEKSTIAPGVTQEIGTMRKKYNQQQLVYYLMTIDTNEPTTQIHANYKDNSKEAASKNFGMQKVATQMDAAQANHNNIENYTVVGGINGSGYNMSTGETRGILVMEGEIVHENGVNSSRSDEPFFAIDKDGKPHIYWNEGGQDWENNKNNLLEAINGFPCNGAGTAPLVKGGVNVANMGNSPNARTAIGVNEETGEVFMLVADGKLAPYSEGCDMYELAEIFIAAGCTDAINLDGGGSTTYVSRPEGEKTYRVVNTPCDGAPRTVSASLFVVSTAPDDKEFNRASIDADAEYITPNGTINLTATGITAAGTPVDIPSSVTWAVDETYGTIENANSTSAVFQSNGTTGTFDIRMMNGEAEVGKVTINVVVPTKFSFKLPAYAAPYDEVFDLTFNVTYSPEGKEEEEDHPVTTHEGDITVTIDNTAASVNGLTLTTCAQEADPNQAANLTAKLVCSTLPEAKATFTPGKSSTIIFDFEEENARNKISNFKYDLDGEKFAMSLSIADRTTGKVHDGNHSLKVTMDMTPNIESAVWAGVRQVFVDYIEPQIDITGAVGIGYWIWIPDEDDYMSVMVRAIYGKPTPGTKTYKTVHERTGINYDEGHWYYAYYDLTEFTAGGQSIVINPMCFSFMLNGQDKFEDPIMSVNNKLTYYIDSYTVDYATVNDDRTMPVIGDVTPVGSTAILTRESVFKFTDTNEVAFRAPVSDEAEGRNNGIKADSAEAYIDGKKIGASCDGKEIQTSPVTLAPGEHTLKLYISDNSGNTTNATRRFTVSFGSAAAVKLEISDKNLLKDKIPMDSVLWVNVTATDIDKIQSVSMDLDLTNIDEWELEHVVVNPAFQKTTAAIEGSYNTDENIATFTFNRAEGAKTPSDYGSNVIASIPVRAWGGSVDQTAATNAWNKGAFFPVDVSIEVDRGEIEYVEDYKPDVLPVFGGKLQVNTECYHYSDNVVSAPENAGKEHWHFHDEATAVEDKTPTCTEFGYSGVTICKSCGTPVAWGTITPPTGHNYVVDEATGERACSTCGAKFAGEFEGRLYKDGKPVEGWQEGDTYYENGVKLGKGMHQTNDIVDDKPVKRWHNFGEDGVCIDKKDGYTGYFTETEGVRTPVEELPSDSGTLEKTAYYYIEGGEPYTGWLFFRDGSQYKPNENKTEDTTETTPEPTPSPAPETGGESSEGTEPGMPDKQQQQAIMNTIGYHVHEDGSVHSVTNTDTRKCVVSGNIEYKCNTCGKTTLSEKLWWEGHKWDSDVGPRTCTECGQEGMDIGEATLNIMGENFEYTGSEIRAAVLVYYKGLSLSVRSDKNGLNGYVSYKNNTDIGVATVHIRGEGDFYGELEGTFNIVPQSVKTVTKTETSGDADSVTINLSWEEALGAEYYTVLRYDYDAKEWVEVGEHVETNSFSEKLPLDLKYYYQVASRATDENGDIFYAAKWSNPVSGTVKHVWGEETNRIEATCQTEGHYHHVCTQCGFEEDVTIPKLEHQVETWEIVEEATTSAPGERKGICGLCHEEVTEEIPQLPPVFTGTGSSTAPGNQQETVENEDGSTTTTTTKPDGSTTETTKQTDGTVTEKNTDKSGVITETTTKPDNTVTEKVTQTDGSSTERTTTPDGVVGQKSTDAEGKVTSAEVVIPKEAEKQDVVTAPVEVPAAKTAEEAPEISVRTESTESKKVEIPVTEFGPGTVAIIVHEDGTEEVVRDCTIGENGVVLNVEGDVTLKIVDKAETFEDVEDANHWASNAVEFVAARELFNGTGENKFTPNGSMTRGMMVTVLYRLAYEPDAVEEGFADVKSDAYYSDAVAWAAENGVVNGYDNNTFAPDDNVSREQLVTILHRYAQKKGYATEKRGTLANFADAKSVSSWASDAMSWAVELGLVNGTDASHISPAKSATRAEVATILMRFCEKVVK